MSVQQLSTLMPGGQSEEDTSTSELQQARKEIAQLLQENAQLEFVQQQTERLLSVQGNQIRETVKIELERMDAALQTREQELQELHALQRHMNDKIHTLQIELAEKILLLEARTTEVIQLKAIIHRLSEHPGQQAAKGT